MRSICILALSRVFDSALVLTRDVLVAGEAASREAGLPSAGTHCVATVDGHAITTAGGLRIEPEGDLSIAAEADLLMVPGMGLEGVDDLAALFALLEGPEAQVAMSWIRRLRASDITVAAGCTATFLLAESGVLDGRQATTSWWAAEDFRARYPAVDLQPHMMLTHHDGVVCAGAAMAHMDLALWAIGAAHGPSVADRVARRLLLDGRASQARYMATGHLAQVHPVVVRAEAWIREHLAERILIEDIASAVALSPRTLARRFKEATGGSPLRFVQRLRIEHAVHLLETSDLSFDEIATRVGYREPAGLRRILRRETGQSPSDFRDSGRKPEP
ncbi:MAG: helix-turn-helix domain-containing protein [Acidobacteriota bacterium]